MGGTFIEKSKLHKLWSNHPFHYHIAAYFLVIVAAVVTAQAVAIKLLVDSQDSSSDLGALAGFEPASILNLVFLACLASGCIAVWFAARRIADCLNVLKRQAAIIRNLDFKTDVPLETPIREIFGLGRALRQMRETIQKFMRVSVALSGERDFAKLLGRVIHEMREALDGDGGVIYLFDESKNSFEPSSQRWPKTDSAMPIATAILRNNGLHPVLNAVLANEGSRTLKITHPRPCGFEFLDKRYGSQWIEMVVVPLRSSDNSLIGLICNVIAPDKQKPSVDRIALAEAFASAAAVAIDQQRLLEAQRTLMEAMIKIIAGAIDAKSPYTGGHCERVPELALMLARQACAVKDGPLAGFEFKSEDEWREFRIGAWLHDCGKVTTPEYVVDKATKLETIYNRIHEVRTRFEVLLRDAKIQELMAVAAGSDPDEASRVYSDRLRTLRAEFAFIAECNLGGEFMAQDQIERLKSIGAQSWLRYFDDRLGLSEVELDRYSDCEVLPLPAKETLLSDQTWHLIPRDQTDEFIEKHRFRVPRPMHLYNRGEIYNLSVRRGTLTDEERYKINEHVMYGLIMLEQLPLPKNLRRVPEYAGTHHETLIGSGYPRRLSEVDLSVPMRIMAIADIFEALTSSDRPYKKSKTLSEAVKILHKFKKDKHIDPVLFDLFLTSGVYYEYAQRFLTPGQIDHVEIGDYLH